MPITPHFTLHQTLSHVELDIRVPHVRVTPESIQVVLDCENAILHFASPPYLLILNFAALCDTADDDNDGHGGGNYRFHEAASEACATYEPTIENGMIHLSLKKAAHAQTMWNNLHLLGRMVLPSRSNNKQNVYNNNIINGNSNSNNMKNSTSQWLLEEIASSTTTTTTATTDTRDMREDQKQEEEEEDVMGRQTSTMKRRHHHGYGFGGMFDGVFSDLTRDGLAKEMLESPPDDVENNNNELLNIDMDNDENDDDESGNITIASSSSSASYTLRRRLQRRRMENSKFDPNRYRLDLDDDLDDDYIYQCAMAMKPHWVITPSSGVGGGDGGGCDSNDFKETVVVTKRLDLLTVNQECVGGMDGSPQPPSDGGNAQQQQQRQESYYFTEEESLQLVSIPYPLLSPETSLSRRLQRQQQQRRQNGNHRDSDNDMEENDLTLGIVVGLVDLLFAYVYDHLTTDGDATVESAWTVSILSASLSWMEDWQHLTTSATTTTTTTTTRSNQDDDLDILSAAAVKEVLYSSLRRALVYPYLRNLGFALHCARQVADILTQGPCCILRCLLQTRQVLNHSELYYLGNKLFIDPYLAWIQQQNCNLLSRRLADMAHVIRNLVLSFANFASTEQCKQSLGLDLTHMEQEEEMEDHEHDGQRSSSASDSNDDNSCSSEESQSNDDDAEKQSPESDHKEQWESVKDTAVSSELLDCSLGFSALHIVKPHDSTFMSQTIITDQNPTELPTSECTEQQQQHQQFEHCHCRQNQPS
jgi:SHQ1 protein